MFVGRRPTHHQRLVKAGRSEERATCWPLGNRIAGGECGTFRYLSMFALDFPRTLEHAGYIKGIETL